MDDSLPICPNCGQYATGPIKDNSSGQRNNESSSGDSGQGSFGFGMNNNTSNSGQNNAASSGGSGQGSFGFGMNQNTSNPSQNNAGYQGNPYGNFSGTNQPFTYQRTWKDIVAENCIVTNDGKRLEIGGLKFILYFGIFALAAIFIVNAIFFFSGNLWGNYKHLVHRAESSTQMMDVFFGIVNVCLVVGLFVLWSAIINLKKYSIVLINIIDTTNLLFVIAFYFYTINLEISVPVFNHICNFISLMILIISSNYIYKCKDAFIN